MKKLLVLILVLAMALTCFAGCGEKAPAGTTSPNATQKPSEPVTITFANWNAATQDQYEFMAKEFEKETGIKVDVQISDWGSYWTMLEAGAESGTMPDTFWTHSASYSVYAKNDTLYNLDKFIADSDIIDMGDYPQGLVDFYNYDGVQYSIPKDYDTVGLWYNKEMFDAAGLAYPDATWTWDTLYDAAKKLTIPEKDQYGFCAGFHDQEGWYNFAYQAGGGILNQEKLEPIYDMPETIEGVEFYFDFVKDGLSPALSTPPERVAAFQGGQVAMELFHAGRVGGFYNDANIKDKVDVAVLPSANDGNRATIYNGLGVSMAANCKNPEAAWKWIEYVCGYEGQLVQAQYGTAIPAHKDAEQAWVNNFADFNVATCTEMLDYAVLYPYSDNGVLWQTKGLEVMGKAYGTSPSISVADACKELDKFMTDAIAAE